MSSFDAFILPTIVLLILCSLARSQSADSTLSNDLPQKSSINTDELEGQTGEVVPFHVKANSSILDYLNPYLFQDPTILEDMSASLQKGNLIVIKNAFRSDFAEHTWKLIDTHKDWMPLDEKNSNGHNSFRHIPLNQNKTRFRKVVDVFEHSQTKSFIGGLCRKNTKGKVVSYPTWYRNGEFTSPHNDHFGARSVSMIWKLSKEWKPDWGGSLYWSNATIENAYRHPSFNTLVLFRVSAKSMHAVSPVSVNAEGKRLAFISWFHAEVAKDIFSVANPIEDWYAAEEDRSDLTYVEEKLIMSMDINSVPDRNRRDKLRDLQKAISYQSGLGLDIRDKSLLTGGNTFNLAVGDGIADECQESSFYIRNEESILDYLNPSIFQDPSILEDVSGRLQKDGLVIIKNAFTLDFAEHVWQLIDSQQDWERFVEEQKNGYTVAHHLPPKEAKGRFQKIMDVFEHPKTREFVNKKLAIGRDANGTVVSHPLWYRQGDYTTPNNEYTGTKSFGMVWQLSKEDWNPQWGGAFYWVNKSGHVKDSYNFPSFNTLVLIRPSPRSIHSVTPVNAGVKGKRYTYTTWYHAAINSDLITVKNPVEDWYDSRHLSYITKLEETKILSLDVDSVKDIGRKQKLRDLQKAVMQQFAQSVEENAVTVVP